MMIRLFAAIAAYVIIIVATRVQDALNDFNKGGDDVEDRKMILYEKIITKKKQITVYSGGDGRWYNDPDTAALAACTHRLCRQCHAGYAKKPYTLCDACRELDADARHSERETAEWDGVAMLYSESKDEYYACPEDIPDDAKRIVICERAELSPLGTGPWEEELDFDNIEVSYDVIRRLHEAVDEFNKKLTDIDVGIWVPGNTALRKQVKR